MRPSQAHKPNHLGRDDGSGETDPSHVKQRRPRRTRKHHHQVDSQDQQHASSSVQRITNKDRTPLEKSHSPFELTSRARKSKTVEMPPSGHALPSNALGPKLTKTGRVSKAKKGVKGAHNCPCGKVSLFLSPSSKHLRIVLP